MVEVTLHPRSTNNTLENLPAGTWFAVENKVFCVTDGELGDHETVPCFEIDTGSVRYLSGSGIVNLYHGRITIEVP